MRPKILVEYGEWSKSKSDTCGCHAESFTCNNPNQGLPNVFRIGGMKDSMGTARIFLRWARDNAQSPPTSIFFSSDFDHFNLGILMIFLMEKNIKKMV